MTLAVTQQINIPDDELVETFIRASGPGGQNVNKVASAVQLRFDAAHSPSLGAPVKGRLLRLAGKRATREGEIVIEARRFRTQERNREDARARLAALIARAAAPEKPRVKTKVPRVQKEKRLADKRRRGEAKARRAKPEAD
ncbi:MAG TPA: alternative ribosome rescue aminoacyl-tRNA hydrolase ArfB [Parvularculaceae bacterium]|nr:alternative ribosome rescue aminoacyl-tRNA hydrolase ArfB [Parvularculaceae bacterium]